MRKGFYDSLYLWWKSLFLERPSLYWNWTQGLMVGSQWNVSCKGKLIQQEAPTHHQFNDWPFCKWCIIVQVTDCIAETSWLYYIWSFSFMTSIHRFVRVNLSTLLIQLAIRLTMWIMNIDIRYATIPFNTNLFDVIGKTYNYQPGGISILTCIGDTNIMARWSHNSFVFKIGTIIPGKMSL